jgi:hypothetical protein
MYKRNARWRNDATSIRPQVSSPKLHPVSVKFGIGEYARKVVARIQLCHKMSAEDVIMVPYIKLRSNLPIFSRMIHCLKNFADGEQFRTDQTLQIF